LYGWGHRVGCQYAEGGRGIICVHPRSFRECVNAWIREFVGSLSFGLLCVLGGKKYIFARAKVRAGDQIGQKNKIFFKRP